jgi:5,10-methylenetetrahydromethanopterin reductase
MRFSIRLNNDLTLDEYRRLARAAEEAGFDQLYVSNDLFLRSGPVILGAIAGVTERIEIGSGILNPYTMHPAEIAMLAATMDELTGERFNLGLAAGAADFLDWVGLTHGKPLAAVRETVTAIRGLLAGERVPLDGEFLHWGEEAYLRFRAPRVTPIYLGAMGPRMLQLAGEIADGVLPLLFPPEHYYGVRPLIEQGMEGRDPALGKLDVPACIWVSLAEDAAAARRALAVKIAYYGYALGPLILDRLGLTVADFDGIKQAMAVENDVEKAIGLVTDQMLQIGVVGRPGDLIARLEPLEEAGVDHLSFGPPLGPDRLEAVELLGRHVLPHFRGR